MPTVLVVEDDKLFRMALCQELVEAGFSVLEASDCRSARSHLGAADAATLDYHLPDGNGLSLLREARDSGYQMPAIVLSADADAEDLAPAHQLEVFRVLDKSVDLREVVKLVSFAIALRTARGRT